MFRPITIPGQSVMMFTVMQMKDGVEIDDVEEVLGDICNTVNNTYGDHDGGFYAGQFFRCHGKIDKDTGEVVDTGRKHIVITTFWESFEHHRKSHLNEFLTEKFKDLAELCTETREFAYENLWQGQRY